MERYCGQKACADKPCPHRKGDGECSFEYIAKQAAQKYRWPGSGPPPVKWTAPDGMIVYRSYADFCASAHFSARLKRMSCAT